MAISARFMRAKYTRDIEHLLVSLLEGINLLLEVDVVGGQLSLYCASG